MKEYVNENLEIQRMRQILALGFDDTDVGDGTIKHAVTEDHTPIRNSRD